MTKVLPHNEPIEGEGFILTRHRRESMGRVYLEYWLVTPEGPVKLITPAQREVFFIRQEDRNLVEQSLKHARVRYEYKDLALRDFDQAPVAALYFHTGKDYYDAKRALAASAITKYEDDVRLTERFLMERFIYGNTQFSGMSISSSNRQPPSSNNNNPISLQVTKLKPVSGHTIPDFRSLSVDLECSDKGALYSIGMTSKDFQRVIMIGEQQEGPNWIQWVPNEKALLFAFIASVNEFDPDIFIGWNVINFDFRLLIKRAKLQGISLSLGRGHQLIQWRNRSNEVNQGFVTIPGRLVIDGIDALKSATYYFESFSLEFVSQQLLGKGKKTEDVDNRMQAINHDFKYNKVKLAEYNLQDCQLVLEIFDQTNLLAFLALRSQLTGLELDRQGGSVAAFLNLYLPKLHRAGYVSPNRPENGGLASPGGYVMRSKPGLYQHVLVLDFKSLYPSIIRTFKIDPLGLIEGLKQQDDPIPGYKGACFSRDQHFLPDIITTLWKQRDEAKKTKDAARSQAIKILMNSFYGVLGSGGCPFYDPRLASSITLRGHEIMKATAQWITEAGYEVIYGDTDSTFVWLDGHYSDEDALEIGKSLQEMINQRWHQIIADEYKLDCALEIEFETHFKRFLMPTIRGSEMGSKKRYAGLKTTTNGEELVFKGLETVRSDWTALAKTFQTKLYSMVFSDQDVGEYIRSIISDTRSGHYDQGLVYKKRLRRPLDQYVKNVPPHVKAARLADQINESEGKTLRYQRKGVIAYVMTRSGPEPLEYLSSPIDYDHYIEKQIRPIAEGILPFIDCSYEEIASPQMSLF